MKDTLAKEKIYERLLSLSTNILALLDDEGRVILVNEAILKQLNDSEISKTKFVLFNELLPNHNLEFDFSKSRSDDFVGILIANPKQINDAIRMHFRMYLIEKDESGSRLWVVEKHAEEKINVKKGKNLIFSKLFKQIEQLANLGYWNLDLTTMKVEWSDQVYHIHDLPVGYPTNTDEGINFYHPDYRDFVNEKISRAIEKQESWEFEAKLISATGKEKWVKALGMPEIVDGIVVALEGLFLDITDLKEAQIRESTQERNKARKEKQHAYDKLRKSEELLNGVFNSVSAHILALDKRGEIISFNERWKKNSSASKALTINSCDYQQNYLEYLDSISHEHPYADTIKKSIESVLFGREDYAFIDIKEPYLKENKWFTLRINSLSKNRGVIITKTNITIRKQAQEQLEKNEEWFRLMTERSSNFICVTDLEGNIVYTSPNAKVFNGFSSHELNTLNFIDLVKSEYEDLVSHTFEKSSLSESDNKNVSCEYKLIHSENESIWVESLFDRFNIGDESYINISTRNISEKKLLQEEMRQFALFPKENPNPVFRVSRSLEIDFYNSATNSIMDSITELLKDKESLFTQNVEHSFSKNQKKVFEIVLNENWYIFTIYPIIKNGYLNVYGKKINEFKKLDLARKLLSHITKEYSAFTTDWIFFGNLLSSKLREILPFGALRIFDTSKKRTVFIGADEVNLKNRLSLESYFQSKDFLFTNESIVHDEIHDFSFSEVQFLYAPLLRNGNLTGIVSIENYGKVVDYSNFQKEVFNTIVPQLSEIISNIEKAKKIERQNKQLQNDKMKLQEANDAILFSQYKMLSSQLNPHFIFNALNSVQYFVLQDDQEEVFNYISKFSELMRRVLSLSTRSLILIEEEIEFLEMFLELEKKRHIQKFNYKIEVSHFIEPSNTLIPPMILQPFVENAIIHGIAGLESDGEIIVSFNKENNLLVCEVTDNGVGRVKAGELKKFRKNSESFSSKINKSRLDILKSLFKDEHSFEITDSLDLETGELKGTKVRISLPLQLFESIEV